MPLPIMRMTLLIYCFSYVGFTKEERLVGDAAKNQAAQNPENTIVRWIFLFSMVRC